MRGKVRGSSTLGRLPPHPAGQDDPLGEPAYSLEVARSSGPAWHSQVWRVSTRCQNGWAVFAKTVLTVYFLFPSVSLFQAPGCVHFAPSVLPPLIICSGLSAEKQGCSSGRPTDTWCFHSAKRRAQRLSALQRARPTDWRTHPLTTQNSLWTMHTHTQSRQPEVNPLPFLPPSSPYYYLTSSAESL